MAKFFMAGGVDNNWATDTNWSTTASSGPNNTTHAVAGDDVILDSGSPNCTVAATAACLSLTCTGYTNVLRFQANLTVSGNVTFAATQAAMTADLTSRVMAVNGTSSMTSAGNTLPCSIAFGGAATTATLADVWTVAGNINIASSSPVVNGFSIRAATGLSPANSAGVGTTVFVITGGTWSGAGVLANPVTFDGASTVSGLVKLSGKTVTWLSGVITTAGSTFTISGLPMTMDTSGMTWDAVTVSSGNATLTLNSALLANTLTFSASNTTYGGAAGFTVGTLTGTADAARSITFTQTNTYTVTSAFTLQGSAGKAWTLISSSGSLKVPFVFSGATQNVAWVNATRLDSSSGNLIHSLNGVITNSLNWDTPGGGAMWLYS